MSDKFDAAKHAAWLRGYAKRKTVNRYGGNFWGINRKRCTIITPEMLNDLVVGGYIIRIGTEQFTVNQEEK